LSCTIYYGLFIALGLHRNSINGMHIIRLPRLAGKTIIFTHDISSFRGDSLGDYLHLLLIQIFHILPRLVLKLLETWSHSPLEVEVISSTSFKDCGNLY
jgi:hypothetical protein